MICCLILTLTGKSSPFSSTHLKNFPPKNCTPIIENINQNTRHTNSTLKMLGIAYIKALTTILIPCHLDIARKGLRALNVLKDLKTFKFSFSSINKLNTETWKIWIDKNFYKKSIIEKNTILTKTIIKSSIVQKLVKYFVNPSAIHLRNISIVKIKQNPRFVQYNIRFNGLLLSK